LLGAFLLPLTAAGAYFAARGSAGALAYWTLRGNLVYMANPIPPQEALGRFASYFLPFALVCLPLVWACVRSRPLESRYRGRLIAALILCSLLPAFLGLRFFPHYFIPLYWPLAVGAAAWLSESWGRATRRVAYAFLAVTLVLVLGFQIANAVLYLGSSRVYRETDSVFRRVAERLRADPCSGGASLFVWGYAPLIYYYADLPAASRFVVLAPARLTGYVPGNLASLEGRAGPGYAVPEHWDWLMADLERSEATFVLDTAPAGIYRWDRYPLRDFPRLDRYLRDRYEVAGVVDGVRVFRRQGCRPSDGARLP